MQEERKHKFYLWFSTLLPFLFFYQVTVGNAVFSGIDILKQHVPMKYFNALSFKDGHFPIWNPLTFQGYPHFAEGQSGPLYIGNILMYLAPLEHFIHAYDYTVLIHFALGGYLFYVFFRKKELTPSMAFIASLIINLSPFMLVHSTAPSLHQTLVFFPLLLLIMEAAMNRFVLNTLIGGLLTGILLFIGHAQMVLYSFVVMALYALIITIPQSPPKLRINRLVRLFGFIIIIAITGACIAAVQIIPTLELTKATHRGGGLMYGFYSVGTWLSLPRIASIFVAPVVGKTDEILHYGSSIIYIGVLPMITLMICWRDSKFRKQTIPWLILFVIMYLLAMAMNNPVNELIIKLPLFKYFRYIGRFAFFATFFIAYPVALSLQVLLQRGESLMKECGIKNLWCESAILIALVILMTLTQRHHFTYWWGIAHFTVQLVIAIFLLSRIIQKWNPKLLKALIITHLAIFLLAGFMLSNLTQIYTNAHERSTDCYKIISQHEYTNKTTFIASRRWFMSFMDLSNLLLTPRKYLRYDGSGSAGLYKWDIPNVNAFTPLDDKDWERITSYIYRSFRNPDIKVAPYMEYTLYKTLGVNYLLVEGDQWEFVYYELADGPFPDGLDDKTYLYIARDEQSPVALSVKHTGERVLVDDTGDPLNIYPSWLNDLEGTAAKFDDHVYRKHHISSMKTPYGLIATQMVQQKELPEHEVEIFMNGITERYTIKDPEMEFDGVVIRESFFPGWRATVNGNPTQIYVADNLYKYIELNGATEYEIELSYFPQSFARGMGITLYSIGIWGLLFVAAIVVRRKK